MKNIDRIYEELIGKDKRSSSGKVQFSKNRMKNGGWTRSILKSIFRDVYELAGPVSTWANRNEYERYTKRLAIGVSFLTNCRITKDAVGQQIAWGITNQLPVEGAHIKTYIGNHAIALEEGLITIKDLPSSAKFEY